MVQKAKKKDPKITGQTQPEKPRMSTMERLRQEGKLDERGRLIEGHLIDQNNLKPVIQAVNALLKETVTNRSIPSVTEVHMPKATLLVLAQVLLKVNGLEDQVAQLRELIVATQPQPETETEEEPPADPDQKEPPKEDES